MPDELHVFVFGAGEEVVSAANVQDAIQVCAEQGTGGVTDLETLDLHADEWRQMEDDHPLTINFEDADRPEPGEYPEGATLSEDGWKVTAPAGAWAHMGRGWLASTEV